VSLASGSAWLKFGVDRVRTGAVATISSVGDDLYGDFWWGFGQVAKRQGEKMRKSHNSLTKRDGFSQTGGYEE
jgi:hypothetical protein